MKKLLRSVFVFVLAFSLVLGTGAFTNVGTINVNAATAQVKITPNSKTIYRWHILRLQFYNALFCAPRQVTDSPLRFRIHRKP